MKNRERQMKGGVLGLLAMGLLAGSAASVAAPVVENFDSFADSTVLTTQVSGLTFGNTPVYSAGGSLNDISFPPASGKNVAANDQSGALTIDFAAPVYAVSGRVTYLSQLLLTAYDSGLSSVATTMSLFNNNTAGGSGELGSTPNELLSLTWNSGIWRVRFEGLNQFAAFTLDDLTFDYGQSAVPEPGTLALLGFGLAGLGLARRRKANRVP